MMTKYVKDTDTEEELRKKAWYLKEKKNIMLYIFKFVQGLAFRCFGN